jgi:predicted acylesterase/phospholipase RssA
MRSSEPVPARSRIGLALAGGGPLGAIYEIGALCALEDSLAGRRLNDLDAYVGVSAGGFIAAGLANGMTPRELCASFIENTGAADDIFQPSVMIRPAWGELARRLRALPLLLAQAALSQALGGSQRSVWVLLERLGRVLPTGLFSGDRFEAQLARQFSQPGRTNDFRLLRRKLVLVATDLDSGEPAPFGQPGLDAVPISQAVQASAALPGLFPPVEIDGRHYVDGALKKTLHASVLLDEGLDLLICLNPLVPFDSSRAPHRVLGRGGGQIPRLVDGGLPVVLSQTFRTMIHSRMELGLKAYAHSHPATDIVLFEPDRRDPQLFLAPTFSYAQRRALAEHAFQQTRQMLRERRVALQPRFEAHGLRLSRLRLDDPERRLLPPLPGALLVSGRAQRAGKALRRLEQVLDELDGQVAAALQRANTPGKIHNKAVVITR